MIDQIQPDQIQAMRKGIDYASIANTDGYKKLLDYLESRSNDALKDLRAYRGPDNQAVINLVNIWREREDALQAIQIEVQRGIADGREIAMSMSREMPDMPMYFDDDQGENS